MEKRVKIMYLLMMLVSTTFAALGQLFFKQSLGITGLILPLFLMGFLAYVLSTVIYLMVLSRTHLSWTYGIGGLSYVLATILAATVLAEGVPLLRWAGVFVIFIGVVLIGLS